MNLLVLCNHVNDYLSSLSSMQSFINIVGHDIVICTAAGMIAIPLWSPTTKDGAMMHTTVTLSTV